MCHDVSCSYDVETALFLFLLTVKEAGMNFLEGANKEKILFFFSKDIEIMQTGLHIILKLRTLGK